MSIELSYEFEIEAHRYFVDKILLPSMGSDCLVEDNLPHNEIADFYDEDFKHAVTACLALGERLIPERNLEVSEVQTQGYEYMLENELLDYVLQEVGIENFIDQVTSALLANSSEMHLGFFEDGLRAILDTQIDRLISQNLDLSEVVAGSVFREEEELDRFKNLVMPGESKTGRMEGLIESYYSAVHQNLTRPGAVFIANEIETPYAVNFIYNFLSAYAYELDPAFFEKGLVELQLYWNSIVKAGVREVYSILGDRLNNDILRFEDEGEVEEGYLVSQSYQVAIGLYKALNGIRYYEEIPIRNRRTLERMIKAIDSIGVGRLDKYISMVNIEAQKYIQKGFVSLEALIEQMMPKTVFELYEKALREVEDGSDVKDVEDATDYNLLIRLGNNFDSLICYFPELQSLETDKESDSLGLSVERGLRDLIDYYADKVF